MKVVLAHDWLVGMRGGEWVLSAFCEMFPSAEIYTLFYRPGSTNALIDSKKIQSSFLNFAPLRKFYRQLLPLYPLGVKAITIPSDVDLLLSSSHCVIKGLKVSGNTRHVSYLHSPMRYLYDQYDIYFGKDAPLYQRLAMKCAAPYLKWFDQKNDNVHQMVANSHFVARRIRDIYGRESEIVHPFVDFDYFSGNSPKSDYYCMVTAFAPNKRVDIAIKAFNALKIPLKIIGSGQQDAYLRSYAKPHIEFLGNVERSVVRSTLQEAKALIFPGVEDFGITPLEALAAGTPVIAFKAGGVLETLDERCAEFFTTPDSEGLIAAVERFQGRFFHSHYLRQRAALFSKSEFQRKIKLVIERVIKS